MGGIASGGGSSLKAPGGRKRGGESKRPLPRTQHLLHGQTAAVAEEEEDMAPIMAGEGEKGENVNWIMPFPAWAVGPRRREREGRRVATEERRIMQSMRREGEMGEERKKMVWRKRKKGGKGMG